MLSDIMLSDTMLNVILLSVIILSVMLNVIMLNVIMLNVQCRGAISRESQHSVYIKTTFCRMTLSITLLL